MNDQIAYIENYFNGQLMQEDKSAFERRCLADSAFAEMVAFYISLQNELRQQWIEKKKEEFDVLDLPGNNTGTDTLNENPEININSNQAAIPGTINDPESFTIDKGAGLFKLPEPETVIITSGNQNYFKLWKPLAAVAAVIGIISLGITWWYDRDKKVDTAVAVYENKGIPQEKPDNKKSGLPPVISTDTNSSKLQYPSAIPPTERTAINKKNITHLEMEQLVKKTFVPDQLPSRLFENLEEPSAFYKNGQYARAISGYKKVLDEINAHDNSELTSRGRQESELAAFLVHYYMGQSHLYLSHSEEAITELDSAIVVSPDIYWKSKTEWYLALAYVQAGKIQKALNLLQKLAGTNEARAYQQKAIELKSKLTQK